MSTLMPAGPVRGWRTQRPPFRPSGIGPVATPRPRPSNAAETSASTRAGQRERANVSGSRIRRSQGGQDARHAPATRRPIAGSNRGQPQEAAEANRRKQQWFSPCPDPAPSRVGSGLFWSVVSCPWSVVGGIAGRGLLIVDRRLWVADRGSWVADRRSWVADRGLLIAVCGSWISDRGLSIVDRGLATVTC
jgi:hypothetical protein